jgi:hypothetical protein
MLKISHSGGLLLFILSGPNLPRKSKDGWLINLPTNQGGLLIGGTGTSAGLWWLKNYPEFHWEPEMFLVFPRARVSPVVIAIPTKNINIEQLECNSVAEFGDQDLYKHADRYSFDCRRQNAVLYEKMFLMNTTHPQYYKQDLVTQFMCMKLEDLKYLFPNKRLNMMGKPILNNE